MINIDITPETLAALGGGGGFAWWLVSKLRKSVTHDEADRTTYDVMKETVEQLGTENKRLHAVIAELQQEVAKLHLVVAELTNKLTSYSLTSENQKALDELAKEGKIERRKDRLAHGSS